MADSNLYLHSQTGYLYSSWATWPWFHLLYASFSILGFVQSYWYNYVDLPPRLFDFLHLEGDNLLTSRRKILENQPVLLEPLISRTVYYGILPSRYLNMKKSEHQGCGPIFWLCSFFEGSWIPHYHGHCKKDCSWISQSDQFLLPGKYEVSPEHLISSVHILGSYHHWNAETWTVFCCIVLLTE